MRILRTVLFTMGLVALAVACGGKDKAKVDDTTPTGDGTGSATEEGSATDPAGGSGDATTPDPCAGGATGDPCSAPK
jgi:hypothetical protein